MISARDRLREAIAAADPRDAEVPVVSNVDALPHQLGTEWASLLSAQLSSPVRWKHVLLELVDPGVDEFVELGPGRRAHRDGQAHRATAARTISVATPEDLDKLIEFVQQTMPARPERDRGRAPLRQRAPRRQPGRGDLQPCPGHR